MELTLSLLAVAVLVAVVLALDRYGRRSATWGATEVEVRAPMNGDEWLADSGRASVRMTRAAWVEASAERLWPWIAQSGRGAGWYSYDRLDNGGRPSARHIVSWIPRPRLGDATAIGYLRHLEPGRELVWWLPGIDFLGARFRGVTLYRLESVGERCRLVVRIQADAKGLLGGFSCWLFRVIDGFMARRQLEKIKRNAEEHGARQYDPDRPETGADDQYQLYQVIYASGESAGVFGKESAQRWHRAAIADGVIRVQGDS